MLESNYHALHARVTAKGATVDDWLRFGKAAHDELKLDEADAAFARAAELSFDPGPAIYHRGLINLLQGDYQRGWVRFESRFTVPEFKHRLLPLKRWQGEPLATQPLLVILEQGIGDTFQFLRFVPRLRELKVRFKFECPTDLSPLLRDTLAEHEIETRAFDAQVLKEYERYVSLMSLPLCLACFDASSCAMAGAYLQAPSHAVATWQARLAHCQGQRIGIVWAGRATHPQDDERSCAAEYLRALAAVSNLALVNLQITQDKWPPPADWRAWLAYDAAPELKTWSDTAAVLQCLDAVVSVDTSVVHLAGAMAKPVHLLLATPPDYRWLLGRDDSPWYPSVRLHRQTTRGDWASVFASVARALRAQ